jgi:hypothetical protein
MNQRSLDVILAEAIDRAQRDGLQGEDAIAERVLQDPDVRILLDGYDMHDRAEGLENVMIRDIRRKVHQLLHASHSE